MHLGIDGRRLRLFGAAALQWLLGALIAFWVTPAFALTVQAPAGASELLLPEDRVACEPAPRGWTLDASRRRVRPSADLAPGDSAKLRVAPSALECKGPHAETVTLLVTGEIPSIDPASVTLFVNAGRLELRGQGLEGVRVEWQSGPAGGADVCLNVEREGGRELCALGIPRELPADPRAVSLRWAPASGQTGPDVVTFDRAGRALAMERMALPIGRVVVGRVIPPGQTVDVATGLGRVDVERVDAISSVDCEGARCDLENGSILVDAVAADSTHVTLRVRLRPRVFVAGDEGLTDTVTETLPVVRCPLSVVSGPPLRSADEMMMLVRLDPACGTDVARLRWTVNGEPADLSRVETLADGVYALIRVGRTGRDRVRIAARRREDGSVVALVTAATQEPPRVEASLLLPEYGEIDFIPKNQDARVSVSAVAGMAELVPISVPGAYEVTKRAGAYYVRGVYTSAGYTALRFAYRDLAVPVEFADTDFAQLLDPVQRPLREASIPAPIGATSLSDRPIVAMFCRDDDEREIFIQPGTAPHIPFSQRESCRLVIHRERIPPEYGEQRLNLEVTVTTAGGVERPEARLNQQLLLRHAPHQDVIWLRGAQAQFDRINVRVTHVIDESLYMSWGAQQIELPSAQWSVITENANFRFYATATIPANLFRFSRDPGDLGTGPLALNFGVLSRLTWLDSDGREGIVGLEAGMMGMGLATDRDRHLAFVTGIGISIPLGNVNQPTQAAVNIHAWLSYSFGERTGRLLDDAGNFVENVRLNPWAFVFGPSITIGNVGVFL